MGWQGQVEGEWPRPRYVQTCRLHKQPLVPRLPVALFRRPFRGKFRAAPRLFRSSAFRGTGVASPVRGRPAPAPRLGAGPRKARPRPAYISEIGHMPAKSRA